MIRFNHEVLLDVIIINYLFQIIQSPLETLNLLEIGNAVRQCDNKVLLASLDTFVQKLVKLIKV